MNIFRIATFVGVLALGTAIAHAQNQQTQSSTPHYSNVWRPIDDAGIREGIRYNKNNGVGLEEVMTRAMLQQKALLYLTAIKAASQAEPKNATLVAAYGWALAKGRGSYSTSPQPIPKELSSRFNFDRQFIWDTIQHARDLNPKCWLADIAEASLSFGGLLGKKTKAAELAKRAYALSQNRLTMTTYGAELRFQGMVLGNDHMRKQGVNLLGKAQRLYPNYWVAQSEACFGYWRDDKSKSKAAARQFMALIPPESRNLPWVRRYVDYLGIEKLV